jgi:3-deoxy-D-manno-octulosonate 8-phosphate phosphatase (KDO 8-P phosphatase)
MNFVLDVDGVMTTGQFLYSFDGKTHKIFGPHDVEGLNLIKDKVRISFITADKRGFNITKKRIEDMGYQVELVTEMDRYEFVKNKFGFEDTFYMGDGISDAKIIKDCKFGIAPLGARIEARKAADFITDSRAAEGAVCDACVEIKKRFLGGYNEYV